MATSKRQIPSQSTHVEDGIDVDLSRFIDVPEETNASVVVRGDPQHGFVAEIERNSHTWIIEGAGNTAAITDVLPFETLPEQVPVWIRRLLEDLMDVREVSIRR